MKKTTYTKKDKVKLPKKRSKEKLDKEIEKLENEKKAILWDLDLI